MMVLCEGGVSGGVGDGGGVASAACGTGSVVGV